MITLTQEISRIPERVEAGIVWLNSWPIEVAVATEDHVNATNWQGSIVLSALDLESACGCILGQLTGEYRVLDMPSAEAVEKGFLASVYGELEDEDNVSKYYDKLSEEWKRRLAA